MKIARMIELEVNLFFFRVKKIGEYIKMYREWWLFVGKEVRDNYYNSL